MAQVADHQGYQFLRGIVNFGVHDRHVELRLGGQLHPRRGEPALPLVDTHVQEKPLSIALREINDDLLTCEDVDPAELAAEEEARKAAALESGFKAE